VKELLASPWVRVLIIATTVAMCSFALRETASITRPVVLALGDVLLPVAIGFAIAYIVTPAVDLLARRMRRVIAAGLLFGAITLLCAGVLVLVVPAAIKQSVNLTLRAFQGEPYTDLSGNHRWDPGEPFDDLNKDRRRDPPLLASALSWAEDNQTRLKVGLGLGLDDRALVFLDAYEADTRILREHLAALVEAARQGRPAAAWPADPPALGEQPAAGWDPSWPGLLPRELDEAAAFLAEGERAAWRARAERTGAALFRRHAAWLGALRRLQGGSEAASAEESVLALALRQPPGAEARRRAGGLALALESQARQGLPAARDLLQALGAGGGNDASVGNRTLNDLLGQFEASARGAIDRIPQAVGGWLSAGVGSAGEVLSIAIDALLVPIYAFFLVLAMPRLRLGLKEYIPAVHRDQVVRIVRDIERVVAAFFRGRLIICSLCSLTAIGGFLILDLSGVTVPYATLFGLAIGLATTVPLAGLLFVIPAMLLALLEPGAGPLSAVLVFSVYLLVQTLDTVLIPLIMGRDVELHPVVLIIALLLCGKLLGVLGLILAVPIAATCRILAREFLWPRLRELVARPQGFWRTPPPPAAPGA
jgi:predicted PurR-regulated permease PerM